MIEVNRNDIRILQNENLDNKWSIMAVNVLSGKDRCAQI